MTQKICMTHGYYYKEGCKDCEYCQSTTTLPPEIKELGKVFNPGWFSASGAISYTPPARKDDSGKPDMSLITYSMLEPAAKILEFGAKKYGERNYRNHNPGFEKRLIAATLRHLLSHTDGDEDDPESGEPHLAHALASLMLIFDRRAHTECGEEL